MYREVSKLLTPHFFFKQEYVKWLYILKYEIRAKKYVGEANLYVGGNYFLFVKVNKNVDEAKKNKRGQIKT